MLIGLWIALAGALGVLLVVGLTHRNDPTAITRGTSLTGLGKVQEFSGYPAPALSGERLDGKGTLSLASYRGRPVVANVWASWCEPCKLEAPALASFARSHPSLAIVGINTDSNPGAGQSFAGKHGFAWPSLSVPDGAQSLTRTEGQPITVLIGANGEVTRRIIGRATPQALATLISGVS